MYFDTVVRKWILRLTVVLMAVIHSEKRIQKKITKEKDIEGRILGFSPEPFSGPVMDGVTSSWQ